MSFYGIYEQGANIFRKEIATLRLADTGDRFNEYHNYVLEALNLIRELSPPEAMAWHQASRDCMNRSISTADARKIRAEIRAYRESVLGVDIIMPEVKTQPEALTFLYQFAIEHPDDEYCGNMTDTSLIQAIEEFSFFYIEFFGHGEELAKLLRSNFQPESD